MAIMKEIFDIVSCIPGFVVEDNVEDPKVYQYRIHVAQDQLDLMRKKYADDKHSRTLISLVNLEVVEFETDLYSNHKFKDKEFMNDIVNFILSQFAREFGVRFDKKTYNMIFKKTKKVFLKNYDYGAFLDRKAAADRLIDYLIMYLTEKYISCNPSEKLKTKISDVKDDAKSIAELDYESRKSSCKYHCVYGYYKPRYNL